MRMPTRGLSATDIATIPRAGKRDALHGRVRELARCGEIAADARDAEDPPAAGHERMVALGRAGMEDERAELRRLLDPGDR